MGHRLTIRRRGSELFAYDLRTWRGVVLGRAVSTLRSVETQPSAWGFVLFLLDETPPRRARALALSPTAVWRDGRRDGGGARDDGLSVADDVMCETSLRRRFFFDFFSARLRRRRRASAKRPLSRCVFRRGESDRERGNFCFFFLFFRTSRNDTREMVYFFLNFFSKFEQQGGLFRKNNT